MRWIEIWPIGSEDPLNFKTFWKFELSDILFSWSGFFWMLDNSVLNWQTTVSRKRQQTAWQQVVIITVMIASLLLRTRHSTNNKLLSKIYFRWWPPFLPFRAVFGENSHLMHNDV